MRLHFLISSWTNMFLFCIDSEIIIKSHIWVTEMRSSVCIWMTLDVSIHCIFSMCCWFLKHFHVFHSHFHSIFTLGPLLYHFENLGNELSIELSYEDIKNVILQYGFHIEVRRCCSLQWVVLVSTRQTPLNKPLC